MALSEIKTNIQKRETKDESQANGRYKIRQIIIKIMEYTHVHISKIKTVHLIYSMLTQQTKEIKKIISSS